MSHFPHLPLIFPRCTSSECLGHHMSQRGACARGGVTAMCGCRKLRHDGFDRTREEMLPGVPPNGQTAPGSHGTTGVCGRSQLGGRWPSTLPEILSLPSSLKTPLSMRGPRGVLVERAQTPDGGVLRSPLRPRLRYNSAWGPTRRVRGGKSLIDRERTPKNQNIHKC